MLSTFRLHFYFAAIFIFVLAVFIRNIFGLLLVIYIKITVLPLNSEIFLFIDQTISSKFIGKIFHLLQFQLCFFHTFFCFLHSLVYLLLHFFSIELRLKFFALKLLLQIFHLLFHFCKINFRHFLLCLLH